MDAQKIRLKEHAKDLLRAQRAFRQALVALRRENNLTLAEVAERLGMSECDITKFEAYDSNLTLNEIRRYALAVDADIEFIVRPRISAVSKPILARDIVLKKEIHNAMGAVDWKARTIAQPRGLEHV